MAHGNYIALFYLSTLNYLNKHIFDRSRIMELCHQVKKLKSVVHVSSAYVNSYLLETEEILYPAPTDADKLIDLVNKSTDEELEKLTPRY